MNVINNNTIVAGYFLKTTDIHVLTDGSNHRSKLFFYCLRRIASPWLSQKGIDISSRGSIYLICYSSNEILEFFILCYKVSLAVYFNDSSFLAIFTDVCLNNTLSSDTSGFFLCLCKTILAKPFNSLVHITICICKCLLTIHHAGTCFFS